MITKGFICKDWAYLSSLTDMQLGDELTGSSSGGGKPLPSCPCNPPTSPADDILVPHLQKGKLAGYMLHTFDDS